MRGGSDTIFAAATGAGRAAVTIVRVSGVETSAILLKLCGSLPTPRRACLRTLRNAGGDVLDRGFAFWFPGPASYTGEDCAEFHIHGGRATLDALSRALVDFGARPADAGEFTRRGFLHGKYDLIEAEAVGDLIEAETEAQRRQAIRQLSGELGTLYSGWSNRLRDLVARSEAAIDFAGEDDVHDASEAADAITGLRNEVEQHLGDAHRGERLRTGLVFAVVGAPNVGKSSLVNNLARHDVAIVADTPGTTRDVIETRVIFGDVPVTLLDTAGIRATEDPVEAEGVRRAELRARDADLVLHIQDASLTIPAVPISATELVVANKVDLAPKPVWASHAVSARTGEGIGDLRKALNDIACNMTNRGTTAPLTRARHRAALTVTAERLRDAEVGSAELQAEDLRLALFALGRITGHADVEDILDSIFRQFCIGK